MESRRSFSSHLISTLNLIKMFFVSHLKNMTVMETRNQLITRVSSEGRQQIKVDGKSNKSWQIKNDEYVHIQEELRLDALFSHKASSFYHITQLKPYNSEDSDLAVFTLSISKDVLQYAFNTVDSW